MLDRFCIGCGYPLHHLPVPCCPECGRGFDPNDLTTMSMGRPIRPWQRWLLRPLGWRTISLALVGMAALLYLSQLPTWRPIPPGILWQEYRWPGRYYFWPPTVSDVIDYAGVYLWVAFLLLAVFWRLARLLVPRAARNANVFGIDVRNRHRALIVSGILSVFLIVFGWPHRIGSRWMARVMAPYSGKNMFFVTYPNWDPWRRSPVDLSPAEARWVMDSYSVNLPRGSQPAATLKRLVEGTGRASLPTLVRAVKDETDPGLLAAELCLIGLCRDPATADLLIEHLQDPNPSVRAAAADAIGLLRQPSYSIAVPIGNWIAESPVLDRFPINLEAVVYPRHTTPVNRRSWSNVSLYDEMDEPPIAVKAWVRPVLEKMMLSGSTAAEREAAARTLVVWPPDAYQLRVAEWGVWINSAGHLAVAKSIVDEIPPFVHTTGNPTTDFDGYFLYPMEVTKPIVHLTSNVPLAADVRVRIEEGGPWFAFPKPDDFEVGNEPAFATDRGIGTARPWRTGKAISDGVTNPPVPPMPSRSEGYPWLSPHHRIYPSDGTGMGGPAEIFSLGVRWQSLIISPQKPGWMSPPLVPSDRRFDWWSRLREVPGSWVASCGEAERFLYYDGPTRAAAPVDVTLEPFWKKLHFARPSAVERPRTYAEPEPKDRHVPMEMKRRDDLPAYEGLFIQVRAGVVTGERMEVRKDSDAALDENNLPLHGDAVADALRQMLLRYGLTGPEAEGLIAAWTPQFFQREGRRFVLRMSPEDYARQCPMQVRPTPTEVVRLGLVLTEFDQPSGTENAHAGPGPASAP